MKKARAFTLAELLVVIVAIAILAVMVIPLLRDIQMANWRAVSTHTLSEMGASGARYLTDHDGEFWKYRDDVEDGVVWWFGFETWLSLVKGEGNRMLDVERGPLGPYAIASGGVKSDPAFTQFPERHKPKFSNGNYGYGYNAHLGGGAMGRATRPRLYSIAHPANVVMFATSAQVNTFQRPASEFHPMIEEFYLLDSMNTTVHFRYGGKALAVMLDGSVRELPMDPTTLDWRMPNAQIGRFAPIGSTLYLTDSGQ